MRSFIYGLIYTAGIQLFGRAVELPWIAGFGIWLSGLGVICIIIEATRVDHE